MAAAVPAGPRSPVNANLQQAGAAAAAPMSVVQEPDPHLTERALGLLRRQEHINQQQALPIPAAPAPTQQEQQEQPAQWAPYVPGDRPSFEPPRSSSAASRAATPPRRRVHSGSGSITPAHASSAVVRGMLDRSSAVADGEISPTHSYHSSAAGSSAQYPVRASVTARTAAIPPHNLISRDTSDSLLAFSDGHPRERGNGSTA